MTRDLHRHRRLAVHAEEAAARVLLPADRGQRPQREDAPRRGPHRERLQRRQRAGHVTQHHAALGPTARLHPQRLHQPRRGQRLGEALRRDPQCPQPSRGVRHRHAARGPAAHRHAGHPRNGRQPRADPHRDQQLQGPAGGGRRDQQRQQRGFLQPLGDEVGDRRRRPPRRQLVLQQLQPFQDGQARQLHVGPSLQLHRERRLVVRRHAGHAAHPAHPLHRGLNGAGDRRFDRLRRRAGPAGRHRQPRELHRGAGGQRQPPKGHHAPQQHRHGGRPRHRRPAHDPANHPTDSPLAGRVGAAPRGCGVRRRSSRRSSRRSCHRSSTAYAVGSRKKVTSSAETLPPMMPAASGW